MHSFANMSPYSVRIVEKNAPPSAWLWRLQEIRLGDRLRIPALDFPADQVTAVLGHSGAGKTSLLNLLVGFEKPDAGTVTPHPRAQPFFWVPQNAGLWPHLTAREHLRLVRGKAHAECDAALDARLAAFDLAERARARPATLSSGECARLAVARALAFPNAAVLVMDEPLAHVDSARSGSYWRTMRGHLQAQGTALIFSTHSPEIVLAEATHAVCLQASRLRFAGDVPTLYQSAPDEELANFLGPVNWLPAAEAARWLSNQPTLETPCVRPEKISLEVADDARFVVTATRFFGSHAEAELHDPATGETRRFFHRPANNAGLRPGSRVRIQCLR